VHKIIEAKLEEHASKVQVVQMLQEDDYHARLEFCQQTVLNTTVSSYFLEEMGFLMKQLTIIGGKFNGNRWETEKPQNSGNMTQTPQNSICSAPSGSQALSVLSF
jgi:hypothetical protein